MAARQKVDVYKTIRRMVIFGAGGISDAQLLGAFITQQALVHGMAGPGSFHLHLTSDDQYSRTFANIYFGD